MSVWIEGKRASLKEATEEAARMLASARLPVIAGLGSDVAGARAAVRLAARLGAVVDHMDSERLLRDLDVMREAGLMYTTPNEARLRADVVLLVGDVAADAPDPLARVVGGAKGRKADRRVIWMCPPRKPAPVVVEVPAIEMVGRDPAELPNHLALLRARIAGRPVAGAGRQLRAVDQIAANLKAAKFGVAVWSAAALDPLAIEMLCGLVSDLNETTRFTGLPLAPPDNARGVMDTCAWMSGFPVRTGFARGRAEHDPWRFDAVRAVDSGEADGVLWISAYRPVTPRWTRDVPLVALTIRDAPFRRSPRILIEVGRPGVDHDAVEFRPDTGTFMPVAAAAPTDAPPVARVLADIAASLSQEETSAC